MEEGAVIPKDDEEPAVTETNHPLMFAELQLQKDDMV